MVLGLYYLTFQGDEYERPGQSAGDRSTSASKNVGQEEQRRRPTRQCIRPRRREMMAYETKQIDLQEWIYVRWNELVKTTVGRVIFNLVPRRNAGTTRSSTAFRAASRRRLPTAIINTVMRRRRASWMRSKTSKLRYTTLSGTSRPSRSADVDPSFPQSKYRDRQPLSKDRRWTSCIGSTSRASSPKTNATTRRSKSGRSRPTR